MCGSPVAGATATGDDCGNRHEVGAVNVNRPRAIQVRAGLAIPLPISGGLSAIRKLDKQHIRE